jgi:hypothetical protein
VVHTVICHTMVILKISVLHVLAHYHSYSNDGQTFLTWRGGALPRSLISPLTLVFSNRIRLCRLWPKFKACLVFGKVFPQTPFFFIVLGEKYEISIFIRPPRRPDNLPETNLATDTGGLRSPEKFKLESWNNLSIWVFFSRRSTFLVDQGVKTFSKTYEILLLLGLCLGRT